MTASLISLGAAALLLSWQGEPGITCTVQISPDLQDWESLPWVFEGDGQPEALELQPAYWPVFVRMRGSAEGDTNSNGLPDFWEWSVFGCLDIDPDADPDGDGRSNLAEWQAGSDPLDFYDGGLPVLRISSGKEWLLAAGEPSLQPLAVSVLHPSGEPWPQAPVTLQALGGQAALLVVTADRPDQPADRLTAWTDELGRIGGGPEAIHVRAPDVAGRSDWIRISAGRGEAALRVTATGIDFGQPPRGLRRSTTVEGASIYSWSGDPAGASAVLVEEADGSGGWVRVLRLAAAELPEPDPVTGEYAVLATPIQQP